jgi:hypothetical protein
MRAVERVFLVFLWLCIISLFGCPGALPSVTDCPSPAEVFSSPELLESAEVVATPKGCECSDAPLRPVLTSSWPGGCSYTYEARCEGCAIDVTWRRGTAE